MRTCVRMPVVCVLLPRFELVVAVGARETLLRGPAALAPESGREQLVGEVSAAAEGFGIHPGMRMGEALARCPRLALVPPDPVGVADAWERVLVALEAAGALVEPGRPGLACFEARGLRRLHGGSLDGVLEATRETLRRTGVGAARLGAGPSRFCAIVAAAARARARRAGFVAGADGLAGERVALLRADHRPELAALPEELERLGIATLGALAALPRAAVADRFGRPGLLAHDLAGGDDTPLRAAPSQRGPRGGARARGVLVGQPARAGARAARRPAARAARARRAHAARRRASARRWSRAARGASASSSASRCRRGAHAPRRSPSAWRCCPRRPSRCACPSSASGRRIPPARRSSTRRAPAVGRACARPSARRAPPRGPTPRCASWPSIPTRACPSAAPS